ncbi:hypothetical protein BT63DRAFT_426674 [Microthyrium microscopicum]|uniref:2EXR domain-containing protein n=1 Tax=Microthyrium microscopicum TaxID=703497 RepID=A0A6A6U9N2_9PEZI|nr:hypothetical protein BT63DRAFT_426674 [Microthyrium microscopicum]
MDTQPHLKIFNTPQKHDARFPLFTKLPPEIRFMIWQCALQRNRIIKLSLRPLSVADGADTGSYIDGTERYHLIVNGIQLQSKIFQVNRESREAALVFYRVHLPCQFPFKPREKDIMKWAQGVFHYNPEWDFLSIYSRGGKHHDIRSFANFLHRLKNDDPKHVGLLHLAVNRFDTFYNLTRYKVASEGNRDRDPHDDPPVLEANHLKAIYDTLDQLQEVFFICTPQTSGRRKMAAKPDGTGGHIMGTAFFNRAHPIWNSTLATFDRLERDPRLIPKDLEKVSVRHQWGEIQSRDMLQSWQRMLKHCGINEPLQAKYTFLLATVPQAAFANHVFGQKTAREMLKHEDSRVIAMPYDEASTKRYEEQSSRGIENVFGFWLFSLDSPSALLEKTDGDDGDLCKFLDLSNNWPGLGVFDLP